MAATFVFVLEVAGGILLAAAVLAGLYWWLIFTGAWAGALAEKRLWAGCGCWVVSLGTLTVVVLTALLVLSA